MLIQKCNILETKTKLLILVYLTQSVKNKSLRVPQKLNNTVLCLLYKDLDPWKSTDIETKIRNFEKNLLVAGSVRSVFWVFLLVG